MRPSIVFLCAIVVGAAGGWGLAHYQHLARAEAVAVAESPKSKEELLASETEVKRLVLIAALLDYPIEQNRIHSLLGIPDELKPAWGAGGVMGDTRGMAMFWPLYKLPDGSSYALKVFYSHDTEKTTGRIPLITSIEVVYLSRAIGHFVADPHEFPLTIAPQLRTLLKNSGLSPREFTEPGNLRWCVVRVMDDMMAARKAKKAQEQNLKVNQPTEIEPTAATPQPSSP